MKCIRSCLTDKLSGGDLRSPGDTKSIIKLIVNQDDFDILFSFLFITDRLVVMKAADSVEKITRINYRYLDKHKSSLLSLMSSAIDKELKWHLAQIVPRLKLSNCEKAEVFSTLKKWLLDKNESKIVRVNSLQALSEICHNEETLTDSFGEALLIIANEGIPSLNARIKKLRKRI